MCVYVSSRVASSGNFYYFHKTIVITKIFVCMFVMELEVRIFICEKLYIFGMSRINFQKETSARF